MKHAQIPTNTSLLYDVAIIGAGIAGSLCANLLSKAGHQVCVLEKSRGTGGRAGSKRLNDEQSCDLGTPFIRSTQASTQAILAALSDIGVAQRWPQLPQKEQENDAQYYVGTPKMSALTRHWLNNIALISNTRIHHIERIKKQNEDCWQLHNDHYSKHFFAKRIVIATPAPQAAILLANTPDIDTLLLKAIQAGQTYQSQWAMWLETETSTLPSIIEATDSPLARLIKDNQKPCRTPAQERWVLQTTPEWAQKHLNKENQEITELLTKAFKEQTQLTPSACGEPHRWLLSRSQPIVENAPYLWDKQQDIGLIGDWLSQGDAEGAMLSALSLCDHLSNELSE
ncbi:NAD(P)/FAD-dependent oxidoreductase [Marinomonas sp. NPDC078689]|jgi:predicted NAD/FAD-dependent oxidoreductase|uniref:NAD(P)/FAD-dependent oxidoreductase n=1 Tax=Marinomonas sp. NPDC078689 TaxID=3364147 RepID=UPI0037CC13B7